MALIPPIRKIRELFLPQIQEDGSVDITGIDFSAASMYLNCPRQYYFRYLRGLKSPPGIAMVEGTSHHYAMEQDNRGKIAGQKALTAPQLTELFVDKLRKMGPEVEQEYQSKLNWEDEDEEGVIKRAKVIHQKYADEISPTVVPLKAESEFIRTFSSDGKEYKIYGAIDLTTEACVWDYKVTRRAKSERDAVMSLQLSAYAFVEGKNKVGFINPVKATKPYVNVIQVDRTEQEKRWALEVIAQVIEGIRKGSFPVCDPANFLCCEKYCGYWKVCRGKE